MWHLRKREGYLQMQEETLERGRARPKSGRGPSLPSLASEALCPSCHPRLQQSRSRTCSEESQGWRCHLTFLAAQAMLVQEASRVTLEGLQLQGHVMASGNCCWEGLWWRKQGHQDVSLQSGATWSQSPGGQTSAPSFPLPLGEALQHPEEAAPQGWEPSKAIWEHVFRYLLQPFRLAQVHRACSFTLSTFSPT